MKMQGEKAVNSAVKEYQTNIEQVSVNLPLPESQIVDYHAKFYKSAKSTFIREVRGDESSGAVPKYAAYLIEDVDELIFILFPCLLLLLSCVRILLTCLGKLKSSL
jgi:hypothetical protein